jgi:hypothetical protein
MPIVRRPPLQANTLLVLRLASAGLSLWAAYEGYEHWRMAAEDLSPKQQLLHYGSEGIKFGIGLVGSLIFGWLARVPAAAYDDKQVEFRFTTFGIPTDRLKIQIDWITRFIKIKPGEYSVFYKLPYSAESVIVLRGRMADAEQFLRGAKIGRRQPPPSGPPMGP